MSFRTLGDPFSSRFSRLGSGSRPGGGVVPVVFLFRDDFPVDEAAPLATPRTADPGPGIGTIVDTTNVADIVSEELVLENNVIGNPGYWGDVQTRVNGIVTMVEMDNTTGFRRSEIGFGSAQSGGLADFIRFRPSSTTVCQTRNISAVTLAGVNVTTGIVRGAVILQDSRVIFLANDNIFSEWTFLWVSEAIYAGVFFPAAINSSQTPVKFSYLRCAILDSPWDIDFGAATEVLAGARSAGDTFTHEADCLIEFEVTTVPAALQIEQRFRIQDASNFWQVTIDSTGALDLDEVVATVVTQRGTAAGVIVNGDRIVIIADDETIRVYEANVLRITYALAVNFKTETAGELETEGTGGAVSDIISWPRVISGDALTALNRVADD